MSKILVKKFLLIYFYVFLLYEVQISSSKDYKINLISEIPKIFQISDFLTEEECDYLIAFAKPRLTPSKVMNTFPLSENSADSYTKSYARTSWNYGIPVSYYQIKIIRSIQQRIAATINRPISLSEPMQIQRYQYLQKYSLHYDDLDSTSAIPFPSKFTTKRELPQYQRTLTFLVYLSDVSDGNGGETIFPYVVMNSSNSVDFDDQLSEWATYSTLYQPYFGRIFLFSLLHQCWKKERLVVDKWFHHEGFEQTCHQISSYFHVRPQKGTAIVFYPTSSTEFKERDMRTMHGSCPILSPADEKWTLQQWFYEGITKQKYKHETSTGKNRLKNNQIIE